MDKTYHLAFAAGSTAADDVPVLLLPGRRCREAKAGHPLTGKNRRDLFRAREMGGTVRCSGCSLACFTPKGIRHDQEFRIDLNQTR